ncbi:PEP-CTERM sorting domain-containing protein [Colwellia sp. MB02u-18]|nr:PEP-CTERM sorting domain-containing protein [Colwellia sp. MB3u-45]MBA6267878.1 PEP-CTERM sorting domain-containing protein [Colwellia sp. MB3u-43]MBA6322268.1 PEP-CTERM sorting domain-containing protein [Colwellia sp. MB02u-19]MBA6323919.1 PEP-CTERM sorting domain-containing protein [Colwellia sp. MB02u-18]MBA6331874.1 PEP-CTERM sorting domain-containing protein [Colwellia sp. MB02u-12]MBA6343854.1 PEP-CTERM sorting domain-containing protein [Colwellia sp. MB02u-1]
MCFFYLSSSCNVSKSYNKSREYLAIAVPEPATLGLFSLLLCFMCLGKYRKQSTLVLF